MFNAANDQRAAFFIGFGKQDSAQQSQDDRQGIVEFDVHK